MLLVNSAVLLVRVNARMADGCPAASVIPQILDYILTVGAVNHLPVDRPPDTLYSCLTPLSIFSVRMPSSLYL